MSPRTWKMALLDHGVVVCLSCRHLPLACPFFYNFDAFVVMDFGKLTWSWTM